MALTLLVLSGGMEGRLCRPAGSEKSSSCAATRSRKRNPKLCRRETFCKEGAPFSLDPYQALGLSGVSVSPKHRVGDIRIDTRLT